MVEPNWAIERAHLGTVLGNQFTVGTYEYAGKPLVRIPISAPCTYPWDDAKDFAACRRRFLWFGSSGFVHKGLDLVLEAFAGMPDFHLTVCGPFAEESLFLRAYHKELFEAENVAAVGWIDVAGPGFLEIARSSLGVVYPTCSEGGGGSVISCMHAGLIPVVSAQASVDVGNGGVTLQDCSVAEIRKRVRELAERPAEQLQRMARESWELARRNHTRERFAASFREFLKTHVLERVR
jgi:glycosyltransferase involved in cell wall biosynthesis